MADIRPSRLGFKIEGLSTLYAKLGNFGPKIQASGMRKAAYAGAVVIRDQARANAPVGSEADGDDHPGLLKRNIVVARSRTPKTQARYVVTLRKITFTYADTRANRRKRRVGKKYSVVGPAFYGRFVELGRKNPRMTTTPYMMPAIQSQAEAAIEAVKKALADAIDRAARSA